MRTTTQITCLDVKRIAGAPIDHRCTLEFPMDLYIDTIRRDREDTAQIVYKLKAASNPELVSFTISGVLSVEGDPTEVEDVITPKNRKIGVLLEFRSQSGHLAV